MISNSLTLIRENVTKGFRANLWNSVRFGKNPNLEIVNANSALFVKRNSLAVFLEVNLEMIKPNYFPQFLFLKLLKFPFLVLYLSFLPKILPETARNPSNTGPYFSV